VALAAVVGCVLLLPPHAIAIGTTVIAPSATIDQPRITLRDAVASVLRDAVASTRFSFIGKVSSGLL